MQTQKHKSIHYFFWKWFRAEFVLILQENKIYSLTEFRTYLAVWGKTKITTQPAVATSL